SHSRNQRNNGKRPSWWRDSSEFYTERSAERVDLCFVFGKNIERDNLEFPPQWEETQGSL
ncbi:hypothetical protein L195_g062034, partial [Trifolium pratense]